MHASQVFLELFSGSGHLARQLRLLGFGVVTLDVNDSPLENLCSPVALSTLQGWIASGIVLGVWLGTPCTTWSNAYTTPVARTRRYILGVRKLNQKHYRAAQLGNQTMFSSGLLISACVRARVPCYLENPLTSKLFLAPQILRLRKQTCCQEFISDYCQYGTAWKKSGMHVVEQLMGAVFAMPSKTLPLFPHWSQAPPAMRKVPTKRELDEDCRTISCKMG